MQVDMASGCLWSYRTTITIWEPFHGVRRLLCEWDD